MNQTARPRAAAAAALALCSILLAPLTGCLGDTVLPPTPSIEETTFAPSLGIDLALMTRTPAGVYYRDLIVGSGAEIASSQNVGVLYTGYLADGTQFDATNAGGPPFVFRYGVGAVIPGFDNGITGMRVGGRRQLVIPPGLAYGPNRNGSIPPNSILVFTVEVVSAS